MTRDANTWIQTYTGRQFWPLSPIPEDISIRDIAHALSMICRYTGHCKEFYSVAEHSCRVCDILPEEWKLFGLLHDASEAYLCDVASPVKSMLTNYNYYEQLLMRQVWLRFKLQPTWKPSLWLIFSLPAEVHEADRVLLATEVRDLLGPPPAPWKPLPSPLPETIIPWSSEKAEWEFLAKAKVLLGDRWGGVQ
jgi:hypothetical protein